MEKYRRLTALAVFREMFDNRKTLYDILREFVVGVIASQRLFSFTSITMKSELENNFGFHIPEAVVKSVLNSLSKNDWCTREKGKFIIDNMPEGIAPDIKQKYEQREVVNNALFNRLVAFINERKNTSLSKEKEKAAIDSFCAFLLNEKNDEEFSEYISTFILENEEDGQFQSDLNEIREGVILYSGINYDNKLSEKGVGKSEFVFYLDHEILFHCYGLNGELFKTYFEDFHHLVKEINVAGKKKLIHLRYFPETQDSIDAFFKSAELIVRGELAMTPGNTAMEQLVNGCERPSEISAKKTAFYQYLSGIGIALDDKFVFNEIKFPHNLLGQDVYDIIQEDVGEKALYSLPILNKIHCLRGTVSAKNFYEVKYHFLTGTEATLKTAWHNDIKGSEQVPLATTLDWVTNQFWFKLNKGLGGGRFPSSANVLAKARVTLSTVVNRSVGIEYDKLLTKYNDGELSKELVQSGIVDLLARTVRPEEINVRSLGVTLDFLQRDSIEHFKAEQEAGKLREQKQFAENERLRQELAQEKRETAKLKDDITRKENEKTLERIRKEITKQEAVIQKADARCSRLCCSCLTILVLFVVSIAWGIHFYFTTEPWDTLGPKVSAFQILWPFAIFLGIFLFRKPLTPIWIRNRLEHSIKKRIYSKYGVSKPRLQELKRQRDDLIRGLE